MHVGYGAVFQNPNNALSDAEVYRNELRLAEMVEQLGFDSIWGVEHHFDDYTMCPDVLQFLSYMAGRTSHIKLGSGVVVLPWHDPIRVAEQVALLDHVSNGRVILGLGRGLARIEYDGFRLEQNEGATCSSNMPSWCWTRSKTATWKAADSRASRAARFVRVPRTHSKAVHTRQPSRPSRCR